MGWTVGPQIAIGGAGNVYVQQTAPTGTIPVGSLWMQTDASNHIISVNQWNGTTWVSQVFNATNTIEAGTVIATLLAAGIVVAGIIDGTTVNAATFNGSTFNGTNWTANANGTFFYSGTPALGNLIASIASTGGTDTFGNVYFQGVNEYNSASGTNYAAGLNQSGGPLNLPGISVKATASPPFSPPGMFAAGSSTNAQAFLDSGQQTNTDVAAWINVASKASSSGTNNGTAQINAGQVFFGALQSVDVDDNHSQLNIGGPNTAAFVQGVASLYTSANSNLEGFEAGGNPTHVGVIYENTRVNHVTNATTFFDLKDVPVVSGVLYHLYAVLVYTGNQAAGSPIFAFDHGGVGSAIADAVGYTSVDDSSIGVWLNTTISSRTGPALTTTGHYMKWEMTFTAPSTGNLTFSVACTVAADTWNAKSLDLFLRPLS